MNGWNEKIGFDSEEKQGTLRDCNKTRTGTCVTKNEGSNREHNIAFNPSLNEHISGCP